MVTIVEQKVDLGKDAYGRAVTATRKRAYDGKTVWEIKSAAMDQRDTGESMYGLTDANIAELVAALGVIGGK